MKEIFLNTQAPSQSLVYQEIKHLLNEYDHVKVENRGLRVTWNFYKSQKEQISVIPTQKESIIQKKVEIKKQTIKEKRVEEQKKPIITNIKGKNNEKI